MQHLISVNKVLSKLMETFKSVCKLIQSVWPEKLAALHISQLGVVQTVVNVFEKKKLYNGCFLYCGYHPRHARDI